jgi:hypothetical protein
MYWFTPLSYSYTAIALNEFTWTVRILPLRCAAKPAVALRNGPAPRSGALERFVYAPRGEEVQEYSRVTNATDGRALLKGQGLYTDEWRMWAAIGCVDPFVIAQRGTPRVLGRIPLGWGPPRKARCSK